MINKQLFDPESIVVVGASNDIKKPGGKLFYNILQGDYSGALYALNPKEESIQGKASFRNVDALPDSELAILAVPAAFCPEITRELASKRGTKAFIIVSAGFAEENEEGARIEKELVDICNSYQASLIGPNCIGMVTPSYKGVFTLPAPTPDPGGCDFISGSGATAVFIMETGIRNGLRFHHVVSVGNSAQLGVEDVLQHFDETYRPGSSSRVKILYFETIKDPDKLLKHASSLYRKGCRIAAIKAGTSRAGSRAASSHTGAMASSDTAVEALFRKAGIIRCRGREELTTVASVLLHPALAGKNIAIITHAGGPAVMLTDVLAEGNMDVPMLSGPAAEELRTNLFPGASVANPIDILATGNAEQLDTCLEFCEKRFQEIDAIVVIFGTPGLYPVFQVYDALHRHMVRCSKPIFPVLPSLTTAAEEVRSFIEKGHINFPDEVLLGKALTLVFNLESPADMDEMEETVDPGSVRKVVDAATGGYLEPKEVHRLLEACGIPQVREGVAHDRETLSGLAVETGYPLAVKVMGPVHKTELGGVFLHVESEKELVHRFDQLMQIEGATGVLVQPMLQGTELFVGATYEPSYGHVILCGPGGVYVEVMNDIATGLAPLSRKEARRMIRSLKAYRMLEGMRGRQGINLPLFEEILVKISRMLRQATEVVELDLNPIIGTGEELLVVDARIRIEKT